MQCLCISSNCSTLIPVQYDALDRNLQTTVQRSIEVANTVDNVSLGIIMGKLHKPSIYVALQLYRVLNIRIVLVDVTTWSNGDQITVVSDPETLLEKFQTYVIQNTAPRDSAMLLTYV